MSDVTHCERQIRQFLSSQSIALLLGDSGAINKNQGRRIECVKFKSLELDGEHVMEENEAAAALSSELSAKLLPLASSLVTRLPSKGEVHPRPLGVVWRASF